MSKALRQQPHPDCERLRDGGEPGHRRGVAPVSGQVPLEQRGAGLCRHRERPGGQPLTVRVLAEVGFEPLGQTTVVGDEHRDGGGVRSPPPQFAGLGARPRRRRYGVETFLKLSSLVVPTADVDLAAVNRWSAPLALLLALHGAVGSDPAGRGAGIRPRRIAADDAAGPGGCDVRRGCGSRWKLPVLIRRNPSPSHRPTIHQKPAVCSMPRPPTGGTGIGPPNERGVAQTCASRFFASTHSGCPYSLR